MQKISRLLIFLALICSSRATAQTDPIPSITLTETAVLGRGTIQELEWRPDGQMLAVGSSAGVWLFDTDFEQIAHFEAGYVWDLRWDASGDRLAISTGDGRVLVWEIAADGRTYTEIFRHDYPPLRRTIDRIELSWSPDDDRLAAASYWRKRGDVFDISTGEVAFSVSGVEVLEWSPTGEYIAGIYYKQAPVGLYDAETGELVRKLHGVLDDYPTVGFVAFIADGSQLIGTGHADTHVWDIESGVLLNKPGGWQELFYIDSELSPDGRYIQQIRQLFSDTRNSLIVLDRQSRTWQTIPQIDNDPIGAAWFPDSSSLTFASQSGILYTWVLGEDAVSRYERFNPSNQIGSWSPDESMFATSAYGYNIPIMVWHIETYSDEQYWPPLTFEESNTSQLGWTPDGDYLISISRSNLIWIVTYFVYRWDVVNGEAAGMLFSAYDQDAPVPIVAWRQDFSQFAISWGSPNVNLRDISTHEQIQSFETSGEAISQIIWSPDEDRLATLGGSHEGTDLTVEIWRVDNGERVTAIDFEGPQYQKFWGQFAWSSDGESVSLSIAEEEGLNHTVYVIDANSGDIRYETDFSVAGYHALQTYWGMDNRLTIVAHQRNHATVTLLDGTSSETPYQLDYDLVTGLSWHPERDIFAVTDGESILFYNGADGALITASAFAGRIEDTSWSADGTRLALYGADERIHIWEVAIE